MVGSPFDSASGFDDQDQAETLDETMTVGDDGPGEMRTFEELPEVADLTQLIGDRDDDEAVALDADEFDPDAIGDADFEEDNELDYRAATEEREDDIDGLGPDDNFVEAQVSADEIDGLEEVRDAAEAEGGEDDVTDFQARNVSNEALKDMGYAEDRRGETVARPDRD